MAFPVDYCSVLLSTSRHYPALPDTPESTPPTAGARPRRTQSCSGLCQGPIARSPFVPMRGHDSRWCLHFVARRLRTTRRRWAFGPTVRTIDRSPRQLPPAVRSTHESRGGVLGDELKAPEALRDPDQLGYLAHLVIEPPTDRARRLLAILVGVDHRFVAWDVRLCPATFPDHVTQPTWSQFHRIPRSEDTCRALFLENFHRVGSLVASMARRRSSRYLGSMVSHASVNSRNASAAWRTIFNASLSL